MQIYEAKKICPDLVLADGEDLTPFRNVSKSLYSLLRGYSWCGKIERLGLDEVFMDVTDMVSYNVGLLNRTALQKSFFCLSRDDPEKGFDCDATEIAGCIYGQHPPAQDGLDSTLYMRLMLASHLARFLRLKIEEQGFTSSCGISTNKLLAKLAGNKNKPRNQTTLLALHQDDALPFMDEHQLRAIPGIGNRITSILEAFVQEKQVDAELPYFKSAVTVGVVRTHPRISPPALEKLLVGPGSEKGLGAKVWCLLHGVDDTAVKPGRDVPTQISIEDTYKGLNEADEIKRELTRIAASLLRRVHVDLVESSTDAAQPPKWRAYPKTLRLTTRPYTSPTEGKPYNWARASRSGPLPSFVFNAAAMGSETVVEKLVAETLTPMFRSLNPAPRGWNIGLINICVTNMSGSDGGVPSGRDIGVMFRRQEHVLREFTVYDDGGGEGGLGTAGSRTLSGDSKSAVEGYSGQPGTKDKTEEVNTPDDDYDNGSDDYEEDDDDFWLTPGQPNTDGMEQCPLCGHFIPHFALTAHNRFHSLQSEE
ncbi:hypothetical protein QBC37DRAFT_417476 [Rhypophila decipiens]|uniref:UmuC domain-containing protein n=1 Tax=Rhypophila decipiens TaxID=261697 RepID=A0AAN6YBU7_9PEZI|nr:hypothetical protein QBC37DRAFT_417476 [Rhypophila decipiens]